MAVTPTVQEFLRRANVPYAVYPHKPAYSAADTADRTAIPERNWAKVVICFADGYPIQAIVPANCGVDLDALLELVDAESIRLAREDELTSLFPDCELGAMPPFGSLYHQRVFVDEMLTLGPQIVFNAGTHRDAVAMRYTDFEALANPVVGQFARRLY